MRTFLPVGRVTSTTMLRARTCGSPSACWKSLTGRRGCGPRAAIQASAGGRASTRPRRGRCAPWRRTAPAAARRPGPAAPAAPSTRRKAEERVADAGDDDVSVVRSDRCCRHMHEMPVADAARARCPTSGAWSPCSSAGRSARPAWTRRHAGRGRCARARQRRQHADRAEQPAAEIADRYAARTAGRLGVPVIDMPPPMRLHHLVERRPVRVGTGLAEAGDRAGDDARIDCRQRLMVDAQPLRSRRAPKLSNTTSAARTRSRKTAWPASLFRSMQTLSLSRLSVRKYAPMPSREYSGSVASTRVPSPLPRRLHLDSAGAQVRQQHRAVGSRKHVRQVQHGDVGERAHAGHTEVSADHSAPTSRRSSVSTRSAMRSACAAGAIDGDGGGVEGLLDDLGVAERPLAGAAVDADVLADLPPL